MGMNHARHSPAAKSFDQQESHPGSDIMSMQEMIATVSALGTSDTDLITSFHQRIDGLIFL